LGDQRVDEQDKRGGAKDADLGASDIDAVHEPTLSMMVSMAG
jgi:hypothetical protein